MPEEYYQSAHSGQQIDHAISRIASGELDKLAAGATNAASAAQSALSGVQTAIKNIPSGSTPIANDLTTGGTKMALSAEMGKVLGQRPNPTVLHNGDFTNPVNQRGKTEYTNQQNGGYCIDRWKAAYLADVVMLSDKGLTFTCNNETSNSFFRQFFDYYLPAGVYTISALATEVSAETAAMYLATDTGYAVGTTKYVRLGLSSLTITVPEGTCRRFQITVPPGVSITLAAVKVERGSVQTLAHQDADGNWVLNDPPPDKGLELLKCIQSTADSADSYANKTILHTGNKPSGSYTGNGDSTSRTIETGGIGRLVLIYSTSGSVLVSPWGAVTWKSSGTSTIAKAEVAYSDGVITIASASDYINKNGVTYTYQVL